jgi:hypothetical protein
MEDNTLQEKLAEIHKDIEDWVDENCIKFYKDLGDLTMEEEDTLMDFLRRFMYIREDRDDLSELLRSWEDQFIDLVLIPTAIITHLMYRTLFRNPFFAFSGVIDSEQAENISSCIMTIYQALLSRKYLSSLHEHIRFDRFSQSRTSPSLAVPTNEDLIP